MKLSLIHIFMLFVIILLVTYYGGQSLVTTMAGAREVSKQESPYLYNTVAVSYTHLIVGVPTFDVLPDAISGKTSKVGTPTMDGFQATIMDLINRGYLEVRVDDQGKKKQVFLKINQDKVKDSTELQSYEMDVIKFLRTMAVSYTHLDVYKRQG